MRQQRRLRRFLSSSRLSDIGADSFLSQEETHHLRHILRLDVGDHCLVINGSGREAEVEIRAFTPEGRAEIRLLSINDVSLDGPLRYFRFLQALPRHQVFDDLVIKAQQLGLYEVWPLLSERTQVRLDEKNRSKKQSRWLKLAQESAKQSGQVNLLKVGDPVTLKQALERIESAEEVVVFHPDPDAEPFRQWFERREPDLRKHERVTNCILGPEGGFSAREIVLMKDHCLARNRPFSLVGLGKSILKADTAFVGVAASLRFLLES